MSSVMSSLCPSHQDGNYWIFLIDHIRVSNAASQAFVINQSWTRTQGRPAVSDRAGCIPAGGQSVFLGQRLQVMAALVFSDCWPVKSQESSPFTLAPGTAKPATSPLQFTPGHRLRNIQAKVYDFFFSLLVYPYSFVTLSWLYYSNTLVRLH